MTFRLESKPGKCFFCEDDNEEKYFHTTERARELAGRFTEECGSLLQDEAKRRGGFSNPVWVLDEHQNRVLCFLDFPYSVWICLPDEWEELYQRQAGEADLVTLGAQDDAFFQPYRIPAEQG